MMHQKVKENYQRDEKFCHQESLMLRERPDFYFLFIIKNIYTLKFKLKISKMVQSK